MPEDANMDERSMTGALDSRATLSLFTVFHLNLAFSSIEESRHSEVVEKCYWPLLNLAGRHKIGIESTAWTLQRIRDLDPAWTQALAKAVSEGRVEFIASGYVQMIGPLVPWEMTERNLRYGQDAYAEILGEAPSLALLNEQAYSPGLVSLYEQAGFSAIIMEWGNPASQHPEWPSDWRYYPQRAAGHDGESLPVVWNDSIQFQKFQRYVFGELDMDEVLEYLDVQRADAARSFSLYGNDAEIFDFRPGRFAAEPEQAQDREWDRIDQLFDALDADARFELVTPSSVLPLMVLDGGGNVISLESAADPIPVKKQPKYNICRWAVSGRDDVWANTLCWRLFRAMSQSDAATDADWRGLCRLWQSDYRTHITDRKWDRYQRHLADAVQKWLPDGGRPAIKAAPEVSEQQGGVGEITWRRQRRCLILESPHGVLRLNLIRGLAVDGFKPAGAMEDWLGTLGHGFYDHIGWSSDLYSGHLVAQIIGQRKITDLESVEPSFHADPDGRFVDVCCTIGTALGDIHKTVRFRADAAEVTIRYRLDWSEGFIGSLRAGFVTLNPRLFARDSLYYETANGGQAPTRHSLASSEVDLGATWSFMMSTRGAVGITDGRFILGDAERQVIVDCPREEAAMIGLVTCSRVGENGDYFCRLSLSARELDDTSQPGHALACAGRNEYVYTVRLADAGQA